MDSVKVSPKFQVVIPKKVREALRLKSGEDLQIYILDKTICLQRVGTIDEFRGVAKGLEWKDDYREHDKKE